MAARRAAVGVGRVRRGTVASVSLNDSGDSVKKLVTGIEPKSAASVRSPGRPFMIHAVATPTVKCQAIKWWRQSEKVHRQALAKRKTPVCRHVRSAATAELIDPAGSGDAVIANSRSLLCFCQTPIKGLEQWDDIPISSEARGVRLERQKSMSGLSYEDHHDVCSSVCRSCGRFGGRTRGRRRRGHRPRGGVGRHPRYGFAIGIVNDQFLGQGAFVGDLWFNAILDVDIDADFELGLAIRHHVDKVRDRHHWSGGEP